MTTSEIASDDDGDDDDGGDGDYKGDDGDDDDDDEDGDNVKPYCILCVSVSFKGIPIRELAVYL